MRQTLVLAALMALAVGAAACDGGNSSDSSPAATGITSTTEPADSIAIFGGPEMSRAVLEAALDATGPGMFLMGSASIGDGQFDPARVPSAPARGAKLVATPRDAEFAGRYSAAYPDAVEQPGLRESYDSVYLVALAALAANSSDPAAIRDHLLYVANSPGEPVNASPAGLPRAIELLTAGGDIDLIGTSGLLDFASDEAGQSAVSKAAAEVWTVINGAYTPLETRDVDLVAELGAENPAGTLARGEGITAPIKIGAIASTTGDDAARGAAIANAMQLAVTEINDAGGVGQPLELTVEDDGGDPNAATDAVETLISGGAAAIIGPSTDATAVAVLSELGDDSPVPFLTLAPAPEIQDVGSNRIFSVVPLASMETVVLSNLAREFELEVACVIVENTANADAMSTAFREAFEKKGGLSRSPTVVNPGDDPDYAAIVSDCFES